MDCLVKLYDLPKQVDEIITCQNRIVIRQVLAYEKTLTLDWIKKHFSQSWADECSVAFHQNPISCFIALQGGKIVGFACYDCTKKNFFGPMGVDQRFRKNSIGKNLLLHCLDQMKAHGYAYAIIGGCDGVEAFYKQHVNATIIDHSSPGIYSDRVST